MINMLADFTETRLVLHLDELPHIIEGALEDAIRELTEELLDMVQAREPVRTGRLRSQTYAFVDNNPVKRFIRGRVRILPVQEGVNRTAAAFGALEYGAPGTSGRRTGKVKIAAYRRGGRNVRAYERNRPRIEARRFLRDAAAIMLPRARTEIERAVQNALIAAQKR